MNMTILTQNDVFLNYDHIIAIRVYSGEVSLDNGKTIAAYQVVADLSMPILNLDETENAQEAPQTQIELGVYFARENARTLPERCQNGLITLIADRICSKCQWQILFPDILTRMLPLLNWNIDRMKTKLKTCI